jgi:hypothetical protein
MQAQEAPDRPVKCRHPDRVRARTAGENREVAVEPIDDLNGYRILESPDTVRRGAATEIPQERLRHPRQAHTDRFHDDDRNRAPSPAR